MEIPSAETQPPDIRAAPLPPLPRIWIGHLMGVVTMVAGLVAVSLHPELAKGGLTNQPLYFFLPVFVGGVYWLVCVYQYHLVMASVPGWKHPISPARAVGFHVLPLYNFYWVFKWPQEIAKFVNWRVQRPLMKPERVGLAVLAAFFIRFVVDPGLGLILLFVAASYVSACLRYAFAAAPREVRSGPPFS